MLFFRIDVVRSRKASAGALGGVGPDGDINSELAFFHPLSLLKISPGNISVD